MSGNRGVGPLPGQIGNKTKVGVGPGVKNPEKKAYTTAVRQLLDSKVGEVPEIWGPRKDWTNAQELVERHWALAKSGDLDTARLMIDRAEGKVPTAPEDRASNEAAAKNLGAGITALQTLQMSLGLIREVPLTVEVLSELPALPAKEGS